MCFFFFIFCRTELIQIIYITIKITFFSAHVDGVKNNIQLWSITIKAYSSFIQIITAKNSRFGFNKKVLQSYYTNKTTAFAAV